MRILAIETSGRRGNVALLEDGYVVIDDQLTREQRSAQSLAPAIREALHRVGWRPGQVDVVATTVGPGSFTGLRVGVTAAKTFAYAVDARIVGLNTLQVIAAQTAPDHGQVDVIMNAQRQQLFYAQFELQRNRRPGWQPMFASSTSPRFLRIEIRRSCYPVRASRSLGRCRQGARHWPLKL